MPVALNGAICFCGSPWATKESKTSMSGHEAWGWTPLVPPQNASSPPFSTHLPVVQAAEHQLPTSTNSAPYATFAMLCIGGKLVQQAQDSNLITSYKLCFLDLFIDYSGLDPEDCKLYAGHRMKLSSHTSVLKPQHLQNPECREAANRTSVENLLLAKQVKCYSTYTSWAPTNPTFVSLLRVAEMKSGFF